MKSKESIYQRVMMFSSALVLALLAPNTAQAEEHNDVFILVIVQDLTIIISASEITIITVDTWLYNPWYNYNVFYWKWKLLYKNQNGGYYVYKLVAETYYQDGFNKLKNDPHYR